MIRRLLASLLLLLGSTAARADVAVLVHGYLSSAFTWDSSGVNAELAARGWRPLPAMMPGVPLPPVPAGPGNTVYTVTLPSTAPIAVQADFLAAALRAVAARHPGEPVTLVGHSAGGIVARLALVRHGAGQVERLVTIASPHVGTARALQALDVTQDSGPVGWVKDLFGGKLYHTVKASAPLMVDLAPPAPGTLLYWLNVQPHPDIQYVSVIRIAADGQAGDVAVPGFSQDMNQVPALRGRSRVVAAPSRHELLPGDGILLAQLLAK